MTHAGLKKHGYLAPLMIPMKRGLIVPDEFLRAVIKDAGMEPVEFASLLPPGSTQQ